MNAQEALDNLITALPDDFEDQGEISVLTRAAETQDKLDWQREMCAGVELPTTPADIWAEN